MGDSTENTYSESEKKLAIIICNFMWVLTCWTQQKHRPNIRPPKSLPLTMKAGIFGNFSPKRPMRNGSWKVSVQGAERCLFDTLSFILLRFIWRYFVEVIMLIPEVFCLVFLFVYFVEVYFSIQLNNTRCISRIYHYQWQMISATNRWKRIWNLKIDSWKSRFLWGSFWQSMLSGV